MTSSIENLARGAYLASTKAALLTTAKKNDLLLKVADAIESRWAEIAEANRQDVTQAQVRSLSPALIDRLTLTPSRFNEMVQGVRKVAALPDPVGRILEGYTVESTLKIQKRAVPFGVVGVIYEARPNVTADIAALCLKSGNACVLRGGSEALHTNRLLHRIMQQVLSHEDFDPNLITFVDSTDRSDVKELLTLDKYVDVIIPRGGEALHRLCQRESTIPVIVGGFGICHIFVDESADLEKAVPVIINAKKQKPSACNALDTLLIHEKVLQMMLEKLRDEAVKNELVIVYHDDKNAELLKALGYPESLLQKGSDEDFDEEWLSLKLNLKAVSSLDEALVHMRVHRASHSDAILTSNLQNAQRFAANAGSACVYINASTRFTDGGQFGLGAEVAISTQKLHVRGPMGLEALTTYQYVCEGDYLARS